MAYLDPRVHVIVCVLSQSILLDAQKVIPLDPVLPLLLFRREVGDGRRLEEGERHHFLAVATCKSRILARPVVGSKLLLGGNTGWSLWQPQI